MFALGSGRKHVANSLDRCIRDVREVVRQCRCNGPDLVDVVSGERASEAFEEVVDRIDLGVI